MTGQGGKIVLRDTSYIARVAGAHKHIDYQAIGAADDYSNIMEPAFILNLLRSPLSFVIELSSPVNIRHIQIRSRLQEKFFMGYVSGVPYQDIQGIMLNPMASKNTTNTQIADPRYVLTIPPEQANVEL